MARPILLVGLLFFILDQQSAPGIFSHGGLLATLASSPGDPCATADWDQVRELLWAAIGDGRNAKERLKAIREGPPPPPLQPSACISGAASLHLFHMLRDGREARVADLSPESTGRELLLVVMDSSWLDVAKRRWPIFGLLHLAQAQLEAEEVGAGAQQDRWQPLISDDHLRFRNWIHGHLVHGQDPPLVDSVHFLARADPRAPEELSRQCSAAKAMGYLASALVLAQEQDRGIRTEARHLVTTAESHVKHCYQTEQDRFTLLAILRTEWPLWWLLHSVLMHLEPGGSVLVSNMHEALQAPAVEVPSAASAMPLPQSGQGCSFVDSHQMSGVCELPQDRKANLFKDFGHDLHIGEVSRLEEALSGSAQGRMSQLFRGGVPLRRATAARTREESTAWTEFHAWDRRLFAVRDKSFASAAYSVSIVPPAEVGLYAEASSAGDPYNAEWLQAYATAFERMGLQPHVITRSEEAKPGCLYFWRINQMFGGGQFAGAPGVGGLVGEHLKVFASVGAAAWPRPETMRFYQDKITLRELFERAGVPTPKSWVVSSAKELDELVRRGDLQASDFPVVLKHPFAASSRGMTSCGSLAEAPDVLSRWVQEHQVPCLLQRRVRIARDLRITYVGGEIVHGYWRVKADAESLSTGTSAAGSHLDFRIPRSEIAQFVRSFAAATGIDIGGMDIAFPEPGPGGEIEGPVIFEVSPIFDLNPEPPDEWQGRPYKEYKNTPDYTARRAENYASCAQKIIEYALGRRGRLFVDIDNTVSDAWKRIRRATLPAWPGETFDSAKAHSPAELLKDSPLPGAQEALASLTRDWEVSYLSARGAPGAFQATLQWLWEHGFPNAGQLVLVSDALHKVDWLEDAMAGSQKRPVLLVDDLSRGHHLAQSLPDEKTRGALRASGIPYEVFGPDSSWPQVAKQLLANAAAWRAQAQVS